MKTFKPVLIATFLLATCSQLPAQDFRGLLNQVTRQASQQIRSSNTANRQTSNVAQKTNGSRTQRNGFPWKQILPIIGGGGGHWGGGGGGWVPPPPPGGGGGGGWVPPPPPNPSPRWAYYVYYMNCHHQWVYYGKYHSQWTADNTSRRLQDQGYRTYTQRKQETIIQPWNR